MGSAKALLKAVRHSQPFNRLTTTICRALFSLFGNVPDLIVRHLPRRGRVTSLLPNGRSLLLDTEGDDWISNQLFWRGWSAYEPETTPLFFGLARDATVIVDVGAHIGFHSLVASLANPSARVFALEPHPLLFDKLRRNVAINNLTNITPILAAATDCQGTGTLFVPGPGLPSSSTLASDFDVCPADRRTIAVELTTIDSLAKRYALDTVDLVKIDTETTEPSVLRGMAGCIQRFRPAIICEVLPGCKTGPEIEDLLRPFGYEFFLLAKKGPEARARIVGEPDAFNYLFAVAAPPKT